MLKIKSFIKNTFIIFGFFILGILLSFVVFILEINKILGDVFSYLKKIIKK